MVSKNILLEGLNRIHGANLTLSSEVDQDTEQKSHSICFISFICKNAKKFGIKTFEIDFVIEIE